MFVFLRGWRQEVQDPWPLHSRAQPISRSLEGPGLGQIYVCINSILDPALKGHALSRAAGITDFSGFSR